MSYDERWAPVPSRRQRLLAYAESGRLRDALTRTGGPENDVTDLIVDICIRYCEPHHRPARRTTEGRSSC